YYLPALLGKAQRLERLGARQQAALYYRSAVRIAPPEPQWPEVLRAQLQHARNFYSRFGEALHEHLEKAMAGAMTGMEQSAGGRAVPERHVLGAGAAYGDSPASWRDQCAAGGAPAADRAAEMHVSCRLRASRVEGRRDSRVR